MQEFKEILNVYKTTPKGKWKIDIWALDCYSKWGVRLVVLRFRKQLKNMML